MWRAMEWRTTDEWNATEAALASTDRHNTLNWRHASTAPEESFDRAIAKVYGLAWRSCMHTLQGRNAWRSSARCYPGQWQRLNGVRVQSPPETVSERPPNANVDLWCLPYHKLKYLLRTFSFFLDSIVVIWALHQPTTTFKSRKSRKVRGNYFSLWYGKHQRSTSALGGRSETVSGGLWTRSPLNLCHWPG